MDFGNVDLLRLSTSNARLSGCIREIIRKAEMSQKSRVFFFEDFQNWIIKKYK